MQNARLDDAQAGIKITRRNISNLRYADGTTLMAESKEELKSLLNVTLWSNELSAPLDVSKGCEALCPEVVEDYGFL